MPHFISTVVLCSMIIQLTMKEGAINQILAAIGFQPVTMLNQPKFLYLYMLFLTFGKIQDGIQ